jgi:hypothetical protein
VVGGPVSGRASGRSRGGCRWVGWLVRGLGLEEHTAGFIAAHATAEWYKQKQRRMQVGG